MKNNETALLHHALLYEQGHIRRTEHILKVYALAKLLGEKQNISPEEKIILHASAIVHDIAIKYCKEHFQGDASQPKQQEVAPKMVQHFLKQANYDACYFQPVTDLVLHHHDYHAIHDHLLQLLIEADIIINCYENQWSGDILQKNLPLFSTDTGKELFSIYMKAHAKKQ